MAFKKMKKPKFPPRLWSLVGYPGSGKSTFAAQLFGPILVIDSDHRFTEVLHDLDDEKEVYELSDTSAHNVDPDKISELLNKNMPGSDVKTIVVDSLTAIITPLVVDAMNKNDRGENRNKIAAFRRKALAMRQIQDSVTRWGCDVLWIYHLQKSHNNKAKEIERNTVSDTELARLTRSINLQLKIVKDERTGKRGIEILWARRGRSGKEIGIIWDDTGCWEGMPQKIEEKVYGGLSKSDRDALEAKNDDTPGTFPNAESAISWGFEQGAFDSLEMSTHTYNQVKEGSRGTTPKSATEMSKLWISEVQERLEKMAGSEDSDEGVF